MTDPMLATAGAVPVGAGWAAEIKHEGMRAGVTAAGGRWRVHSRTGRDVTAVFPNPRESRQKSDHYR
ncbi:hypothetical protein [Actinoplanes palleronii]|uniref:hypothetical protein n=1 Tax=Actinoplanes palleronii TaxID=113570 RepID=UPI001940A514|nr:hypothetical protein [Actinoplanes palleronii]